MNVVELLSGYGYVILFLGSVVEGEIFPLAAGFVTTTGHLSLYPTIGVTFLGSFIGDLLWFGAARRWGRLLVERWGRWLMLRPQRLKFLEEHFANNGKKTLFATKFIYSFGHSSLIVAGIARMSWRELIKVDLPASFLWACLFVFLGRLAGSSFYLLRDMLKGVAGAVVFVVVLVIIFHVSLRRRLMRQV